jgi:DNA repair exonuclease SbcCD ATPase subunit
MPELVYKVKFEVDSSNLEKITSGIDPSSSKQVQNLEKGYDDLKNKYEELLNSFKKGTGSGGAVGGASDGFLDMLQNVKTTTSELRKNTSSFKKSIVTTDQSTDAFVNQSEALLEDSIQLQRLREELEEAAQQENLTDKQTEQLNNTINSLANVQRTAVSASKNFSEGLQVVEHQSGTMNKAFSGSNQLLFSFGDLVQDSTQFSQGFAQGMRAIGNNVGFTAELFANLQNNVERHNKLVANGTLKNEEQITTQEAIIKSLKGTGGALIAINGVVLVSQFLFQKLDDEIKKVRDSAKAQAEAISEVAKSFSQLETGVEDPFGLRARAIEIEVLEQQIGDFSRDDELKEYFERTGAGAFFFKGKLLEIGAAFNENDAAFLKHLDRMEALEDQLETAKMAQESFLDVISDATAPLSKYIEFTAALELVNLEAKSGIELTDRTLQSLSISTQGQIDVLKEQITLLRSRGENTTAEISTLVRLISFQEKINELIEKENKLQKERAENRAQLISDTSKLSFLSRRNAEFIAREIEILNEKDEIAKISAQAQLDRDRAQLQFDMEKDDLENRLIEADVNRDQIKRALDAAKAEFDKQLALITAQELVAIAEAQADREVEIAEEKADLIKRITEQQEKDRQDEYQKTLDFIQGTIDDELLLNKLKRENELAGEDEKGRVLGEIDDKYQAKKDALNKKGIFFGQLMDQLEIAHKKEASDAEIALDQKAKDAKIQKAKDLLQIAGTISQGLFDSQKATAVANAVMNTYEAATKALTAAPPPFNKILMAATIASGIAQVKKIVQTKPGDKNVSAGGSGGSVSSPQRGFFDTDFRGGSSFQDPSMDRFTPSSPGSVAPTIVLQGSLDEEVMAYKVKSGNAKIESGTTYLGD